MIDWETINKIYDLETQGYNKVFPNNSLLHIWKF